ncbi:carbamoyl-phosphate synthase large subunit [Asticcacaulis sp.]|uniref:carbamoyl-phosphate synthase large subunit n=1 Tax=Asticcacaulis sp. TaxID=1872648 RepID=UPI002CEA0A6D|nr:carbamoyl-phosphate synthase large subunit [Asticcacaulis sp.]HTM82753.1 carbamoyl-phosphate synthase large subunit [Asticcacaulis sp.]
MPKRTDIKSILIIGAGPIVIGQACEFDYSGVQACKALREEGYRIILVNSNPATIMTDPNIADATYIEPITPEFVEKIIARERPDALLPTMGGQTALNTALALDASGVLKKYNVEMIGAKAEVIDKAEDRQKFRDAMDKLGLESAKSAVAHTWEEAVAGLEAIGGLPAVIRPSFTLAGTGGGIAYNQEEFKDIVTNGLDLSPTSEVLIEESIVGWKEYEMEVVRDTADNCIIVCSIENVDPMGVHTGDSITVAPALTLTDKEYQIMRSASLAVLREIGVETGGSNVQFALNPKDGRMIVIEMNPRVSRSSALASKATGFPIAKIAAKLAVGYTLDELQNDITKTTPASFEPSIDYVVTKIPRFAFEKYPGSEPLLGTSMKSVGEVMAIGRTFAESMQKALRGLETGLSGFDDIEITGVKTAENPDAIRDAVIRELGRPTPDRIRVIAQAFRHGLSVEDIHAACDYEPWFLRQIETIVSEEAKIGALGLPTSATAFRTLKAMGFSDIRLAKLTGKTEKEVRALRQELNVRPVFKRIDTCAAEFASSTAYMYSTYESGALGQIPECEAEPSDRAKAIILGGGPNRIGQGIEFDYCCCHAAFAFKDMGIEAIMVNCNPETVSTDYDTSDRLYFEPLTAEDVLELIHVEMSKGDLRGVVVQFGGQTPLKLAQALEDEGIPILGTSPDAIDLAEDRERFQHLLRDIDLKQPINAIARTPEEAFKGAHEVGYPIVIRPSYVLGGRAMEIIRDDEQLTRYVREAVQVSGDSPVLIDQYLSAAIEVDADALADGSGNVFVAGIMEHIEEAGVHSGDSACSLPPFSLQPATIVELERQTVELARALKVRGLMNVQFAILQPYSENPEIFVLEVNPRASRTVPFVAKTLGQPLAGIAAKVMAGVPLADFHLKPKTYSHVAVKEVVFPFARFANVDTVLGPEMRSTGEVMGLDWVRDGEGMSHAFARAFAKAQLGAGVRLPTAGKVFVSVKDMDKPTIVESIRTLLDLGFKVVATGGTADYLKAQGLAIEPIKKVLEGRPNILDAIKNGEIDLVFNTTEGKQSLADSFSLRRATLMQKIPYYTTASGAVAATHAIKSGANELLDVRPIQEYA